jgi:hypothetical protein
MAVRLAVESVFGFVWNRCSASRVVRMLKEKLDQQRVKALREVAKVSDEVLLTVDSPTIARGLADKAKLTKPTLGQPAVGKPSETERQVPYPPGADAPRGATRAVRGTEVSLEIPVADESALRSIANWGHLDLTDFAIESGYQADAKLVTTYWTGSDLDSEEVNRVFEQRARRIRVDLDILCQQVDLYNESLEPAFLRDVSAARERAVKRRDFASGLKPPEL